MPPKKPAYNIDWIISTSSNAHVCNHRDWFSTFTSYNTFILPLYYGNQRIEVSGFGDVTLPSKTHSTRRGSSSQSELTLRTVLYAPSVACNMVGAPLLADCSCKLVLGGPITEHGTGRVVGLLDAGKFIVSAYEVRPQHRLALILLRHIS